MPADARQTIPVAWGEGLDREGGLMTSEPNRFYDLRNALLHEGKLILRSGFAGVGSDDFDEVDQLIAGHAIRNEALGLIVGYDSETQRVYIYRATPDLELVELLGEWEHDQSSGWGAETPRIIMAEVNGRIFMAHDERLVTRRAPTIYYDPVTGDDVLNTLTADFAGTAGESGESESAAAEEDAIRFRGVVRHLAYLVGWGFGTADEDRPELVRISLPDNPTTFDANHYKVAGDRRDPVLACGPAGANELGTVLMVWKRTETHAISGTERRNFAIQLVEPRHGIVASRAWLNLEGLAIAWGEEGPRVYSGLGRSEPLDLPLGLEEWEPDDLPEEGDAENAFTQYVPKERVGMWIFGRRVYALTARVRNRWRWNWWELGFDAYGAMTFFGTTEELGAPAGYPVFLPEDESRGTPATDPAGTFVDIGIRNENHDGNETVEIWLREVNAASGSTEEPEEGVVTGMTDFSEFAVGDGIPDGITGFGEIADDPDSFNVRIAEDEDEGHYLGFEGNKYFAFGIDAFFERMENGEMLMRHWVPNEIATTRRNCGPGMNISGDSNAEFDGYFSFQSYKNDPDENVSNVMQVVNGGIAENAFADGQDQHPRGVWVWARFRKTRNTSPIVCATKVWEGDLEDEPTSWDVNDPDVADFDLPNGAVGIVASPNTVALTDDGNEMKVSFLSFSTAPDEHPPGEPDDIPPAFGDWFLAASRAVSPSSTQVERVTGLDQGQTYEVELRHRLGSQYNAGAEDTDDPTTWPSVSGGEFSTTADPPTIADSEWQRTSDTEEEIVLTIEPVEGLEDSDILVYRKEAGASGDPTLLDTISGPHASSFEYTDDTISGETAYNYYVATTENGALSDATRVWAGPAAVPEFEYQNALGGGYVVGFSTDDDTLETELHDAYDDNGGVEAHSLRATADAGETEVDSGTLTNVPDPEFTFDAKLRHKETSFSVDDYGEFTTEFSVTVPGSE